MRLEQWDTLTSDNVIKYQRSQYRLLFKDPLGYWLTETLDVLDRPLSFKKLIVRTGNIRGFSLVK